MTQPRKFMARREQTHRTQAGKVGGIGFKVRCKVGRFCDCSVTTSLNCGSAFAPIIGNPKTRKTDQIIQSIKAVVTARWKLDPCMIYTRIWWS